MKYLFPFIICCFLFTGCKKILHEEDYSFAKINLYEDLLKTTNGLYYKLANCFNFAGNQLIQLVNADDIDYEYYLSDISFSFDKDKLNYVDCEFTDNIWISEPSLSIVCSYGLLGLADYSVSNSQLELWRSLYSVIISANNIITQFENTENIKEEFRNLLGETYFIRGYCYYRLVRIYGNIPLIDNIDIDYTVEKSSFTEIYALIENDFLIAEELLPDCFISSRSQYETPHKGTAKAFLAELYLTMAGYPVKDQSKYALAAKYAGEVIDSADLFGYELLTDFADLWNNEKIFHKESIFTIYYRDFLSNINIPSISNMSYSGGYTKFCQDNDEEDIQYNFRKSIIMPGPVPEAKFYNTFPKSYRKDKTYTANMIVSHEEYWNDDATVLDSIFEISQYFDSINPCTGMAFLKTFSRNNDMYDFHSMYNNYLLRYAHILLTYAEAKARSGQLDNSAYEAVNMIRRRANNVNINTPSEFDLQPGLSPEQFADSVVWERAWEFAGEPEGRWFDLLRLEMVDQLPELRYSNQPGPPDGQIPEDFYFAPIPEEEIWLNPNLGED